MLKKIDFISETKKAIKAKETIEIYMPLARKINNQKLTDELNNLAFKYNVQNLYRKKDSSDIKRKSQN